MRPAGALRERLNHGGCGFRVSALEVKMYGVALLEPRKVSALRSLEVVASRRLPMYHINGILIRDWHFVRSRDCFRFSECPFRDVLL